MKHFKDPIQRLDVGFQIRLFTGDYNEIREAMDELKIVPLFDIAIIHDYLIVLETEGEALYLKMMFQRAVEPELWK